MRDAERRWRKLFESAWKTILESEDLKRLPPKVRLRISSDVDASECAKINWHPELQILISKAFLPSLHQEVEKLSPALIRLAFASPRAQKEGQTAILSAVEDIAISFVLLHELFHLMGGHFGWLSKHRNIDRFDERHLGFALAVRSRRRKVHVAAPGIPANSPSRSAMTTSYVLESEADCNAIQWLTRYSVLAGLRTLLRAKDSPMTDFAPKHRQAAFRLALAAIWLVIRRMESSRTTLIQSSSEEHPLPITRLFMAFGTFVKEYSAISDISFDDHGGGYHRLSDDDVTSMREFLMLIMRPVLIADWNPDRETVSPRSLEAQMSIYFPDFANHMLDRAVSTVVGKEMIEMEKARFRMDKALKPFRYFPTAELRRLKR